jgi:hypothetical protein
MTKSRKWKFALMGEYPSGPEVLKKYRTREAAQKVFDTIEKKYKNFYWVGEKEE